tara:strand:- start:1151 stop:1498 length:348 start_codon:yes stop_codon:yes gene_type:complete
MVPIPGTCLSGIQQNKTTKLVINVANPILHPVTWVIPWAKTVQGLTPTPAAMSKASPKPKSVRPMIRKVTETIGGVMVNAFGELQKSDGTSLTDKNFGINLIFDHFSHLLMLIRH